MKRVFVTYIALVFALGGLQAFAETGKTAETTVEDTYPLKTCVVSDEALGSMGDFYVFEHEGQEVRFCCKGCKKDFLKKPEKYMAKLEKAKMAEVSEEGGHGEHAADAKSTSGHKAKAAGGHDHGHH